MTKIVNLTAREILDSRGIPTIETTITVEPNISFHASVPSGASKGSHEAAELRDEDLSRFSGLGVTKAVNNVSTTLKKALLGKDVENQAEVDGIMIQLDGTDNKSNLGANSILSVSMSLARAAAGSNNISLYNYIRNLAGINEDYHQVTPLFNVINGGLHGGKSLSFQEFMVIPNVQYNFRQSLEIGVQVYQILKKKLKEKNCSVSLGDEGGFTPELSDNHQVLKLLKEAVDETKYIFGKEITLGLDCASNTFYKNKTYMISSNKYLTENEYLDEIITLKKKYQLFYLEDPLPEDSWDSWTLLTQKIGTTTKIVGDDLLVTSISRLKKAVQKKSCNSIVVKLNQVGTLTETLNVVKEAKRNGLTVIISHRSAETTDDFIADLAVGVKADFVKFGAPARGERVVKYNRLLAIYQK